jgi:mono/diheme cytochrome c family protein
MGFVRMGRKVRSTQRQQLRKEVAKGGKRKRSLFTLFLLLLVWSLILGWGLAQARDVSSQSSVKSEQRSMKVETLVGSNNLAAFQSDISQAPTNNGQATTDPVSGRLQLGQQLYLDNCATCHLALPPGVLPSETWQNLLQETQQHYGTKLPRIITPTLLLMWDYLRTYSRPQLEKEAVPYRVTESRYLKALHPRVNLPQPTTLSSCLTCHPGAEKYNFRSLTAEWENSP